MSTSTSLDVLLGCFGYCIARLHLIVYTICRHIAFREPLGVVANIIYRIKRQTLQINLPMSTTAGSRYSGGESVKNMARKDHNLKWGIHTVMYDSSATIICEILGLYNAYSLATPLYGIIRWHASCHEDILTKVHSSFRNEFHTEHETPLTYVSNSKNRRISALNLMTIWLESLVARSVKGIRVDDDK